MDATRPSFSTTVRLAGAAVLPVLGLVGVATGAVQQGQVSWWLGLPVVSAVVAPGVVGWLIVRRHPRHVIGWLLLVHSLFIGVVLTSATPTNPSHAQLVEAQLTQGGWVLLYVCLVLVGYLFPDGHALSRGWRRWVVACMAGYLAFVVGAAFDPGGFHQMYPHRALPVPGPPTVLTDGLGGLGLVLVAASLVGTVVCARQRLRRAEGDERLQMLWFAWAALSIPAMLLVCWLDQAINGEVGRLTVFGIAVFASAIPVMVGIGILRYRLFDIELVLSRTLTYGAMTLGVVGVYGLVLWLAGQVLGDRSIAGLIGVGVVAVAVQPAHGFLRRRVERWVYGDRSDPALALRRLSDRVEQTTDPTRVVHTLTESVAEALRVQRCWVELVRDDAPVQVGEAAVRVPLTHRGERLGDLAVEVPRDRQLSTADLVLLHDLARHAAVVVSAVHLTLDLQRSRARLVTTREEERRRLRRDLHDGLGPSLAAIVLKLNAAEGRRDEHDRNVLLAEAREETRQAIAEVRRLVDDLRPPAIDEVGLVGAIRQRVAGLSRDGLEVTVTAPAAVPPLPAAVEVAAFRIASEAVTNVVRHSGAHHCAVQITVDGVFELVVADDGQGAATGTRPGVGWTSMTERAAELGGSCTISRRTGRGTVVRAVLPLPSGASAPVDLEVKP